MVGKNEPALLEADEDMDISDSIPTTCTTESFSASNSGKLALLIFVHNLHDGYAIFIHFQDTSILPIVNYMYKIFFAV